ANIPGCAARSSGENARADTRPSDKTPPVWGPLPRSHRHYSVIRRPRGFVVVKMFERTFPHLSITYEKHRAPPIAALVMIGSDGSDGNVPGCPTVMYQWWPPTCDCSLRRVCWAIDV